MEKVEKRSLNGIWKLKNEQKSINIEADVPGSIFEALIKNNIISIDEEVYPQKERVNFYKKHIDKYIEIVGKIGKIYCDLNID